MLEGGGGEHIVMISTPQQFKAGCYMHLGTGKVWSHLELYQF